MVTLENWQEELRKMLPDEIRTLARMVNTFDPKTDAELIAVALPNLHIAMHAFIEPLIEEAKKSSEPLKVS